jgi:hypothetical protein
MLRQVSARLGAILDRLHRAGDLGMIAVGNLDLRGYGSLPLIVDDNGAIRTAFLLIGNPECRGGEPRTWLSRDAEGTMLGSEAACGAGGHVPSGRVTVATREQRNGNGAAHNSGPPNRAHA